MEQLLKKLKNAPIIKTETSEEEQLKYLEETGLNDIVNKGLVELYRVQPENPITFLASFLINEDNAKKIIESIEKAKIVKESLEQKQKEEEDYKKKMIEEMKNKEEEKEKEKEKLRETIISCTDFEDKLNNICDQLKVIIGATGVYVSSYEYKRKAIEKITDDENAHIDPDNIKVLRYIHWNEDHNFLHGKYLPRKKGVTYSLFLKGQEGEDDEEEEGGGEEPKEQPPKEGGGDADEGEGDEEEKNEQPKDLPIKMLEIQDVVNTKKMYFYREPRLGSYLCFNIGYKSSLNYNSLLSAIKNLQEYQTKNDEYEKAKAEKEEEEKQNAANEDENKDNDEGENEEIEDKKEEGGGEGEDNEKEKLIKPVLEDFEKEQKTLIISMDTLGQDRTFSESEKSFAQEISKLIRDSIEALEKQKLENDRDLRIEFLKSEKPLVDEWTVDKIEVEEENAVKEYTNSDEFLNKEIADEEGRRINEEFAKVQWSINTLTSGDFQTVLEMFEKFEFVQYEKAFQNIFYFAKTEPNLINEPETNKLYWKFAKAHWVGIFETLRNYTPLGAKPEKISPIFKGNFILENLNPFLAEDKVEALQEYSFVLYRLIKFIVDTLKTRKSDILWRHASQREAIKNRNEIIKNNKKIDAERKKALEEAKRQFNGEPEKVDSGRNDGGEEEEEDEEVEEKVKKNNDAKLDADGNPITFNEEEFLQLYDQEHPKVPIPDEVKLDEDNDFDLEEEALPNEEEEEEGEEGDDNEKKQGDTGGDEEV